MRDRLFAFLQWMLPHHLLSRLMHRLARSEKPWIRDPMIRFVIRHYDVNLEEAEHPDPASYPHFNAFFTRRLRPGARPIDPDPSHLVSPVDGTISQIGRLQDDRLLQAKGRTFTLEALLGGADLATPFRDGAFATLYLAPRDYHRIHMPHAGCLTAERIIPGRLFSVGPATVARIDGLFARNERVVWLFDTPFGPLALVPVGALFVGSIESVWAGELTPPHARRIRHRDHPGDLCFEKGEEIGRFNYGSTVILLLPRGAATWRSELSPGSRVQMGEWLATLAPPPAPRRCDRDLASR